MQSRHGKKFYLILSAQIHPQTSKPTDRAKEEMMKTSRRVCYFQATTHSSGPGELLFLTAETGENIISEPDICTKLQKDQNLLFFNIKRFNLKNVRNSCSMKLCRTQFYHSRLHSRHRFKGARLRRKLISQVTSFSFPRIHRSRPLTLRLPFIPTALHYSRRLVEREKVTPAPNRST